MALINFGRPERSIIAALPARKQMIHKMKSLGIKLLAAMQRCCDSFPGMCSSERLTLVIPSGMALLLSVVPVYAERPLYVEGLITESGKWRLDASIAYANRDGQGLRTGEPLLIQTGPTSFLPVYADVSEETTNSDTIATTVGLRYGLTTRTELYGRTSGYWSETRSEADSSASRSSSGGLSDAWIGMSHMFKDDDDKPGLIGFAEVAVLEREEGAASHFKAAAVGMTAYKAIDPIVLSMNAAYRFGAERPVRGMRRKPGSIFVASGSVAFAANDRISLSAGAQWTSSQGDSIGGTRTGLRRTSTDLLLGVGYGATYYSVVNLSLKSNVSGREGADLNVAWSYTF